MKNFNILMFFVNILLLDAQTNPDLIQVKWINSNNGLSEVYVNNCITDNNGFVWIGTELGLFRYDWEEATCVKNSKYPKISTQRITNLFKDSNTGVIYFSTSPEEKQYSITDNQIKQLKDNEGIQVSNNIFLQSNSEMFNVISKYNKQNTNTNNLRISTITNNSFYYIQYNDSIVCLDKKGVTNIIDYPKKGYTVLLKFKESVIVLNKEKIGHIVGNKISFETIDTDGVIKDFIKSGENSKT